MPWDASAGQLGGPAAASMFAIVKQVDRASPQLRQVMGSSSSTLDIRLRYYQTTQGGQQQVTYDVHLTGGHIGSIDEYVQDDGTHYERIVLSFDQATLTWTK